MKSASIKVCHLTSAHKASDVRIFLKECSSLHRAGFEVHLVVAAGTDQVRNGVFISAVNSIPPGRFQRIFRTAGKVYRKALMLDADVYHIHDPELLPYALKLRRKGKRVVYDVHEDVPVQIMGKHWINPFLRKLVSSLFRKYENYVAKRMSLIVAATPFIRQRFALLNENTIDVCNYPLPEEVKSPAPWEKKEAAVCYIGSISRIRGIVEIITAVEKTDCTLHLAGDYSPPSLREELVKLPGWGKVKEYGFVDRSAITEILGICKAGLVTLYPQINYLDSLPIKMFEYMLSGIPVIASDFPMWKSIVEEHKCGLCVDPKNPDLIAEAISTLMSDSARARTMGENGRAAVFKYYNWANEEVKLEKAYRKLVE